MRPRHTCGVTYPVEMLKGSAERNEEGGAQGAREGALDCPLHGEESSTSSGGTAPPCEAVQGVGKRVEVTGGSSGNEEEGDDSDLDQCGGDEREVQVLQDLENYAGRVVRAADGYKQAREDMKQMCACMEVQIATIKQHVVSVRENLFKEERDLGMGMKRKVGSTLETYRKSRFNRGSKAVRERLRASQKTVETQVQEMGKLKEEVKALKRENNRMQGLGNEVAPLKEKLREVQAANTRIREENAMLLCGMSKKKRNEYWSLSQQEEQSGVGGSGSSKGGDDASTMRWKNMPLSSSVARGGGGMGSGCVGSKSLSQMQ